MYVPIILILVPFHNVYHITMFLLKYIHIYQLFLNNVLKRVRTVKHHYIKHLVEPKGY